MRTSRLLLSALTLSLALGAPPASAAGVADEQAQGRRLLDRVASGQLSCAAATPAQFELMGEAVMGRAFPNATAHERMNGVMSSMMGARGEAQMHEVLGRQAAGCSGGSSVQGFVGMMGSMGAMMGMMGGAHGPGTRGMMQGYGSGSGGYGSASGYGMMGPTAVNRDTGDRWAAADTTMVVTMGLLLVLIVVALVLFRPARRRESGPDRPLDILDERFARGDISVEEYRERRDALTAGGAPDDGPTSA